MNTVSQVLLSHVYCDVTIGAIEVSLDLWGSVVFERFELSIHLFSILEVPRWIHGTLRAMTSPLFNEVVFSILNASSATTSRLVSALGHGKDVEVHRGGDCDNRKRDDGEGALQAPTWCPPLPVDGAKRRSNTLKE